MCYLTARSGGIKRYFTSRFNPSAYSVTQKPHLNKHFVGKGLHDTHTIRQFKCGLNDLRVRIIIQCSDRKLPQHKSQSRLPPSHREPHDKSKVEKTQILCWKNSFTRQHKSMAAVWRAEKVPVFFKIFPTLSFRRWSVPSRNVNGEKSDSSLRNGQLGRGSTSSQLLLPTW